jgi:hypothetical protein
MTKSVIWIRLLLSFFSLGLFRAGTDKILNAILGQWITAEDALAKKTTKKGNKIEFNSVMEIQKLIFHFIF